MNDAIMNAIRQDGFNGSEEAPGWKSFIRTQMKVRGLNLTLYNVGNLFPDQQQWDTTTLKEGYAVHHDAVAFDGKDRNFNGSTMDESLNRIRAVYNWHTNVNGMRDPGGTSWNGVGYHFMIDREGRIFYFSDMDTHRAHVAGRQSGGTRWNELLIGICLMGHFSDGRDDETGLVTEFDRPTPKMMQSLAFLGILLTDHLGREMVMRPHKYYQKKECPGVWMTPQEVNVFQPAPKALDMVLPVEIEIPAPTPIRTTDTVVPSADLQNMLAHTIEVENTLRGLLRGG